jgi:hypothetical protein
MVLKRWIFWTNGDHGKDYGPAGDRSTDRELSSAFSNLLHADIFIPEFRPGSDEFLHHLDALLQV